MLRLTPEIAKQLRALLVDTSTAELVAIRESMPETSKKVDEAFLNFTRNNIAVLLKSRTNVPAITAQVKAEIKKQKQKAATRKTQAAIDAVFSAFPPRNAEDQALYAKLKEVFS